ncbi:methyltransferase domain-containing protein [uncultured Kocuria sp.]|uniref:methyltransferase domain-containing protein n=1 Tax=uncultured Kocuria sp. TaxID=259305 RepID=UPI002607DD95|nr:methyltransferase domain-containing protein [uncultured Kocuria sp.]
MTPHASPHPTAGRHPHSERHDDDGLAELLELDAEILGPLLEEVLDWVAPHVRGAPRTVADIGAGTGPGSRLLGRRFPSAQIVAIDRSASRLERLRATAGAPGLSDRIRTVQADLDTAWPEIGAVDLAWAASSLHELAAPDRLLRELHARMRPGGLLVVVEMDALPRFVPEDIGIGRPGLERRCHEVLARAHWNAFPEWGPRLEEAGFRLAGRRRFGVEARPAPPGTGRWAHHSFRRALPVLADRLAADDLLALEHLLTEDAPGGLLHREDLVLRAGRIVWAAHRA